MNQREDMPEHDLHRLDREGSEDVVRELQRSEERFRLLVESVEDYAIFMLDPDGRVASWNRGAERIKGYAESEILGEYFGVFYPEDDRRRGWPEEELDIAARTGRIEDHGWRLRQDGSRFWASVVITAIRDDDGRLLGYAKVTRDLTERRHRDQEREDLMAGQHAALKQVNAILESITDAFFALDREWRFTYVNAHAEELLRRSRGDLLGQNLWEMFPEAVGSTFETVYRRAVAKQRAEDFVEYYPPLNRWFEVRAYPSQDGLLVYFHDVTERMEAHRELRDRERQLRAVLDVLPLPVFIADADGRVVAMNPAVREFWGEGAPTPDHPEQYAEYRGWWPDTRERLEARDWALIRAVEAGEIVGPEQVEIETFDGERRRILNYARPIRADDGRITGGVAINVDITEQKTHEETERFLAEAGRELASSLDYEDTLGRVARLAVSRVADWCVVYVPHRGGIRRLAVTAKNRELEALANELERRYPPGPNHVVQEVIRTGEPKLLAEVDDALIEAVAEDEEHLELLRAIGFRSLLLVPLIARGEVLGAITLGWAETARRYRPEEMGFVERLAGHAALAVDNARLYEEARRRAGEEAALRRAAAAVARTFTIEEVIQQIADSALEASGADGAFVERIDIERNEVVLVASAGQLVPPDGTRSMYDGSIAQAVIERGEPLLLETAGVSQARFLSDLTAECEQCSAMAVPLADAGEPIGALILVRATDGEAFRPDETARARTFGELAALAFRKIHLLEESERRREDLERVTESRASLIRGFSHDLKNPLGAADGFLSLLEDQAVGELTEDQLQRVARVRQLLRAALDLIQDLVELHRIEGGQIQIRHAPLDLRQATHELTEEYRPQAEAKGLRMALVLPDELPVVESDASRVRQILGNLISNAVKYTPEGGITVRVGLKRDGDGAEWVGVDVVDTGPGMSPEDTPRLFREFSRLNQEPEGAGLGLAISQKIAHALGGRIDVASEVGVGSTFTLRLPLRRGTDVSEGSVPPPSESPRDPS